jgi:hypothetical protein
MRRGEIWTVAGGKDYAGKPRPVVILQDDRFDATASITICAFHGPDGCASLSTAHRAEREKRAAGAVPPDGRQDYHGAQIEDGRAHGTPQRRGRPAAEPGRRGVLGSGGTGRRKLAREIWSIGPAGSAIPLTIAGDGNLQRVTIHSADRNDFLKKPRLH